VLRTAVLTGLVTAGLQPATRLSRLENPMLHGDIEYLANGTCTGSSWHYGRQVWLRRLSLQD